MPGKNPKSNLSPSVWSDPKLPSSFTILRRHWNNISSCDSHLGTYSDGGQQRAQSKKEKDFFLLKRFWSVFFAWQKKACQIWGTLNPAGQPSCINDNFDGKMLEKYCFCWIIVSSQYAITTNQFFQYVWIKILLQFNRKNDNLWFHPNKKLMWFHKYMNTGPT